MFWIKEGDCPLGCARPVTPHETSSPSLEVGFTLYMNSLEHKVILVEVEAVCHLDGQDLMVGDISTPLMIKTHLWDSHSVDSIAMLRFFKFFPS